MRHHFAPARLPLTHSRDLRPRTALRRSAVVVVSVGALVSVGPSAEVEAASTSSGTDAGRGVVRVFTLGKQTAPYGGRFILKPPVEWGGNAEVLTKKITVRQAAGTIVARSATRVSLGPGNYTVNTSVKYLTWKLASSTVNIPAGTQMSSSSETAATGDAPVEVTLGGCRVASITDSSQPSGALTFSCHYFVHNSVTGESTQGVDQNVAGTYKDWGENLLNLFLGDETLGTKTAATPQDLVGTVVDPAGVRLESDLLIPFQGDVSQKVGRMTRTQRLVVVRGARPCATFREYLRIRYDRANPAQGGDTFDGVASTLGVRGTLVSYDFIGGHQLEIRSYPGCEPGTHVEVGFDNGHAWNTAYYR